MEEVVAMAPSIHWEVVPMAQVPCADPEDGISLRPVVLVVDDEPMVADTLAMILSEEGFEAKAAYGGQPALTFAREIEPSFLISDFHMPGMNGLELAITVASELPECGVLLFSGQATEHDLAAARAMGYDFPLLAKPVRPEEIIRHVREQLQMKRMAA
jgi:CheY-like chemotaxis protein